MYCGPAPVRSCVYCTTGPLLRTAPGGEGEKANYRQKKSLPSTHVCCASHKISIESLKAMKIEAFGMNGGSQPGAPNRFWPLCTTPVWFCGIFKPGGKAHWKSYISSCAKKKCTKTQTKPTCPHQPTISFKFQDTQKKKVPRTDIGASPRLSALFLLLGGGCGGFHAEHGLEARGAAVNPLAAFVILRQREENAHGTRGQSLPGQDARTCGGSAVIWAGRKPSGHGYFSAICRI